MIIVKRFRKPCTAMAEDRPGPNGAYEYLTKRARWSVDPSEARTFSNAGHAKTALKSGISYRRPAAIGDQVFICEVVVHTKNAREWVVC